MQHLSELEKVFSNAFNWNKARISFLAQILQALFCVKTVNLVQLASAFQTKAKPDSSYRRIRRFFKDFDFDISSIIQWVMLIFPESSGHLLIIDRTNWKFGKKHINILMLSLEYRGIGIPIFWTVLNTGGASSTCQRIEVIKKVIHKIGRKKIHVLLGDREFIGESWFRFLVEAEIPFLIRVKKRFLAQWDEKKHPSPIWMLYHHRECLRIPIISRPVSLWGQELYVSIALGKGAKEPQILVSNTIWKHPFETYKKRWGVETLFHALKTRGFRLEDTHLTEPDRLGKLIFVLSIALCWACKTGVISSIEKPIKEKKHGRKSVSYFRLGFDIIRNAFLNLIRTNIPIMSLISTILLNRRRILYEN